MTSCSLYRNFFIIWGNPADVTVSICSICRQGTNPTPSLTALKVWKLYSRFRQWNDSLLKLWMTAQATGILWPRLTPLESRLSQTWPRRDWTNNSGILLGGRRERGEITYNFRYFFFENKVSRLDILFHQHFSKQFLDRVCCSVGVGDLPHAAPILSLCLPPCSHDGQCRAGVGFTQSSPPGWQWEDWTVIQSSALIRDGN